MASLCLLMMVMCLIFVGLYANNQSSSVETPISPAALVQKEFCVSKQCMQNAARAVRLMNSSVDPCDNFYEYACGNYENFNPTTRYDSHTVIDDLERTNLDRLAEIIQLPPGRNLNAEYSRKLSNFYKSCTDMYEREKQLGRPFLNKVVSQLGGWHLLGSWDEESWDLNEALKKVQTDFWVDAFFIPSTIPDATDKSRHVITLEPAGLGKYMYRNWYTSPSNYVKRFQEDYKKFIRQVGSLLMRDANLVNVTESERVDRLDQFVNDTYMMEYKIAKAIQGSRYGFDPYEEENKMSLNSLTTETQGVIDWTAQMTYLFNEAGVSGRTKVVVINREYFGNLTRMIQGLPETDRKRMLHNYLIWRVAEIYVQELSWEYVHANRKIFEDTRGYASFTRNTDYCMQLMERYMGDALGALYVQYHLADESKQKITDITENLQKAMRSQLEKTPWMDEPTKQYAREKISRLTFKMGYPDWMKDHDHVDNIYYPLVIYTNDVFGNILRANQFFRKEWNRKLQYGDDRESWIYQPYDTVINLYYYWNEIIAPAGILQNPLFNHNAPHYVTFGSIAPFIARFLHYFVDEYGAHYNKDGSAMGLDSWWTNKSINAYKPMRQCVVDQYRNVTQNLTFGDEEPYPLKIDARRYAWKAIAHINGIRLSVLGYQDWIESMGTQEKALPGVGATPQQMLFLSYAQSHCYNREEFSRNMIILRGQMLEDNAVNMALGQLEEFTHAFQCPVGSKMNHATKCDYY